MRLFDKKFDSEDPRYRNFLERLFFYSGVLFLIGLLLVGMSVFLITLVIINIQIFSISNIFARIISFVIFNCGYLGLTGIVVSSALEGGI